jgi:GT2 family glycosyltransferase
MKTVSIVMPNWNGLVLLTEYFCSVLAGAEEYRVQTKADVEVVVVDDASTDESREWLRSNFDGHPLVRVIELEKNVGFVRAVNRGFEAAKNEVVFLLNNDVFVEPNCIAPLTKHFEDEDVFGVCCRADRIKTARLDGGGKIGRFERGFWRVFLNYEAMPAETRSELISFFGSGGYTAYDRKKLMALRGFQDCLAPIYWEDVEICYRAWKRGWIVLYEPDSQVHHLGSATMKKRPSGEMDIITERNRLLMTWINLHDKKWFAQHVMRLTLKLAASAISFRWNYLRSFWRAASKISKVLDARRIEQEAAVISDSDLARKFEDIVRQPGIYVVENEHAEIAFSEMKSRAAATGLEG